MDEFLDETSYIYSDSTYSDNKITITPEPDNMLPGFFGFSSSGSSFGKTPKKFCKTCQRPSSDYVLDADGYCGYCLAANKKQKIEAAKELIQDVIQSDDTSSDLSKMVKGFIVMAKKNAASTEYSSDTLAAKSKKQPSKSSGEPQERKRLPPDTEGAEIPNDKNVGMDSYVNDVIERSKNLEID